MSTREALVKWRKSIVAQIEEAEFTYADTIPHSLPDYEKACELLTLAGLIEIGRDCVAQIDSILKLEE